MATGSNRNLQIYDVCVGGQSVSPSEELREYNESREVVDVPDTFPCGHVLCHHCIRRHVSPYRPSAWCCPVCSKEFSKICTTGQPNSTAIEYANDNGDIVSMSSNFNEIVAKFNGINQHLPILKKEHVTSRSVGLSHTKCPCDMCDEDHGILRVVQEYNKLQVEPQRPYYSRPYFYRRYHQTGSVVTTYHSKINSSCVCVPCTYKEIQEHPEKFYALTENNNIPELKSGQPKIPMAEVGKLLTRETTPIKALHGKNVIEFEHKFRITDKADDFDFQDTTDQIKRVIQQSEKQLVMMARKCFSDTGNLYHVQERKDVDFNTCETVV